jgi:hypothetical protein
MSELEFIRECVRSGRVFWSYHSNMRLESRAIPRREVLESVETCEIIQHYPADRPLPTCLCLGRDGRGDPLHFVVAMDRDGRNIRLVTVYRPDPAQWEPGFRERTKS